MNELAIIFDRLGIPTREVLQAAGTKWNFLPFTPGLVGGHCIGVDPYYLTARAEAAGYYPQVILSGRRINDGMGGFIAQRLVKLLIAAGRPVKGATDRHHRHHLQGGRARSAQQPRPGHRRRIARIRHRGTGRRPARRPVRGEATNTVSSSSRSNRFTELDGLILAVPHRVLAGAGWAQALRRPHAGRGLYRRQVGRRSRSGSTGRSLLEPLISPGGRPESGRACGASREANSTTGRVSRARL